MRLMPPYTRVYASLCVKGVTYPGICLPGCVRRYLPGYMPPCVYKGLYPAICLPVCDTGVHTLYASPDTRFTVGLGLEPRAPLSGREPLRTVTFLSKNGRKGTLLTVL